MTSHGGLVPSAESEAPGRTVPLSWPRDSRRVGGRLPSVRAARASGEACTICHRMTDGPSQFLSQSQMSWTASSVSPRGLGATISVWANVNSRDSVKLNTYESAALMGP